MNLNKPDRFIRQQATLIVAGMVIMIFIANSILLTRKNRDSIKYPNGYDLEEYASTFLKGEKRQEQGKKSDCSGFTRDVYKHFGIKIGASSIDQFKQSTLLEVNDIKQGNLIFFSIKKNKVNHVGIFLENGKFIHSPGRGKYVRIDSLSNVYWNQKFVAGGKILIE